VSEDAGNEPKIVATFAFSGFKYFLQRCGTVMIYCGSGSGSGSGSTTLTSCVGLLFYLLLAQARGPPLGVAGRNSNPGQWRISPAYYQLNLTWPRL
jgi:hypothetical protein